MVEGVFDLVYGFTVVVEVSFRKKRDRVNEKAKQGSKEVNIARQYESEEKQVRGSTKSIKNEPN